MSQWIKLVCCSVPLATTGPPQVLHEKTYLCWIQNTRHHTSSFHHTNLVPDTNSHQTFGWWYNYGEKVALISVVHCLTNFVIVKCLIKIFLLNWLIIACIKFATSTIMEHNHSERIVERKLLRIKSRYLILRKTPSVEEVSIKFIIISTLVTNKCY